MQDCTINFILTPKSISTNKDCDRLTAAWGRWKKCSGVFCDKKDSRKAKGEDVQKCGTASIVSCRDMSINETPRNETGGA